MLASMPGTLVATAPSILSAGHLLKPARIYGQGTDLLTSFPPSVLNNLNVKTFLKKSLRSPWDAIPAMQFT